MRNEYGAIANVAIINVRFSFAHALNYPPPHLLYLKAALVSKSQVWLKKKENGFGSQLWAAEKRSNLSEM